MIYFRSDSVKTFWVSVDIMWANKLGFASDKLGQGSSLWHPKSECALGIIDRVWSAQMFVFPLLHPAKCQSWQTLHFRNYQGKVPPYKWHEPQFEVKRSERFLTSRHRFEVAWFVFPNAMQSSSSYFIYLEGNEVRSNMFWHSQLYLDPFHNAGTFSISQGYQIYYRLQQKLLEWFQHQNEIKSTAAEFPLRSGLTRNRYSLIPGWFRSYPLTYYSDLLSALTSSAPILKFSQDDITAFYDL